MAVLGDLLTILVTIVVIVAAVAVYWAPTIVAYYRKVSNVGSIAVLNFFGFVVVSWVIAMAMAFQDVSNER